MRSAHRLLASSAILLIAVAGGCSSSSSKHPSEDAGRPDAVSRDAPEAKDAKPLKDVKAKDSANADAATITSIPVTETLTASVLSAPVDVVRDQYGIPHIYGQTFADVAYAEGYFMASDRLVEMDLGRRQAAGTLTELFGVLLGSAVLGADVAMRMHHMTTTAQAMWQQLQASTDPKDMAIAQAVTSFAAGVNAFVADVAAGKASLPQASIGYNTTNFTAWTEVDSFVLSLLQAWELAYDSGTEITFSQIKAAEAATFDASTNADYLARKGIYKDFEILAPQDPTFTLPSGWTGFNGDTSEAKAGPVHRRAGAKPSAKTAGRALASAGAVKGVRPPSSEAMLALLAADARTVRATGSDRVVYPLRASNNFILGPSLTADGHVILGNDMHLGLSNPPIFYIVQLVASGGPIPMNAMGVGFPGIPAIVQGNNEHIAWGMTDSFIDVTDVYQETVVNCADSTPYAGTGSPCVVFNGANVPLTPRTETFNIGLLGKITSTVTETLYDVPQHGPIIPQLDANSNVLPLGSTELSIRYTGYQPGQLLRALVGVITASTMQEAVAAIDSDFTVGGQNWLIGDDQGNFGWTEACSVPTRAPSYAPWLILPGDGTAEWNGTMDRHYIPHAYNPSVGFITTANNDPIGVTKNNSPFFGQPVVNGAPLYLGFDYDSGTRVGRMTKRIQASIAAGHKFTLDDVASIQGDTISEWGQAMAPTFIAVASDLAAEIATPGSHSDLSQIVAAADATAKGLVQQAHDTMAAWTSFDTPSGLGTESSTQQVADSQAALLNAVFYANFAHLSFDDEITALGITNPMDSLADGPTDDLLRKLLVQMCTNPSSLATEISPVTGDNILFDNLDTPGVIESKEQIAAQAIINTLDYIAQNLGSDPTKWAWGNAHTLTLEYLLYSPPSTSFDNLNLPAAGDPTYPNGYPRHGDDGTVDVGAHGLVLNNFTYNQGPAVRFGADIVPSGIQVQNALPGGETFDPASPHYQDQLKYWLSGQPFALAQTVGAVTASAATEYATNKDGRVHFAP